MKCLPLIFTLNTAIFDKQHCAKSTLSPENLRKTEVMSDVSEICVKALNIIDLKDVTWYNMNCTVGVSFQKIFGTLKTTNHIEEETMMKIYSVNDPEFKPYGKVLGYDASCLVKALDEETPLPEGVEYVMSCAALEYTCDFGVLQNNAYGGMPIQIGYCNGHNNKLNCLEYHRDSELNIGSTDFILLLAKADDIVDGKLDTSKVKAFLAKKGQIVEVYETSLHYAPCSAAEGEGFKVAIVLPKGTNGPVPALKAKNEEDKWLTACNKWLLAHADSAEAKQGAYIGLTGENITL